ncbi:hypothetical protein [Streptomyces sp. NPDC048637]|uniref:hypothetical protein n=1 Tax=Streptomyces sp. NPDC048637 TaxID=3155636 RepID=UPI003441F8F4
MASAPAHAAWQPVADLLRATGSDWDRRSHRICVLARTLPPAVADRWATAHPESPDATVVQAHVLAGRSPEHGRAAAARAENLCLRAPEACPADPTPISPRECGSLIGMDEFARRAAETAPHDSPLAMLPLAARTEHYAHRLRPDGPDAIGAGTHWHGPGVAKEIDTALTRLRLPRNRRRRRNPALAPPARCALHLVTPRTPQPPAAPSHTVPKA